MAIMNMGDGIIGEKQFICCTGGGWLLSNFDSVPVVEVKKGLLVRKGGGAMRMIYRRPVCLNQSGNFGRFLFLLVSGTILFTIEYNVISVSNYSGITFMQLLISFAILIIGLLLIYRSLAMTFDQTEITVNPRGLTVRHMPLPYPGSPGLTIPLSQIRYINFHPSCDSSFRAVINQTVSGQPIDISLVDQENLSHSILVDISDPQYAEIMVRELNNFIHL
jgi:hypothetical protein